MESAPKPAQPQAPAPNTQPQNAAPVAQPEQPKKVNHMRALVTKGPGSLELRKDYLVPELKEDEVLIQVCYSTVNQLDCDHINGKAPHDRNATKEFIPGIEGNGVVVEHKVGGIKGWNLLNKKVAFSVDSSDFHGAWAEYIAIPVDQVIEINKETPLEAAASPFLNPMTALTFLEFIHRRDAKAIVQTGAASTVGKMVIRLCKEHNIKTINVVRSQNSKTIVREIGGDEVLATTDADFEQNLKETLKRNEVKLAFDAVGGDVTGALVRNLPNDSLIIAYGNLAEKSMDNLGATDFLFRNIELRGFDLYSFLDGVESWTKRIIESKIADLIEGPLRTIFTREITLEELPQAYKEFRSTAERGKILVRLMEKSDINKLVATKDRSCI